MVDIASGQMIFKRETNQVLSLSLSLMATALSFPSATPTLHPRHRHLIFRPNIHSRVYELRCSGQNSTSNSSTKSDTEPQNVLLKMAWYSSELLGIAASFFRSPSSARTSGEGLELSDGVGAIDRAIVVETIKGDFQRSYFVTGNLTLAAYEEDCEFADPAGSFRGLRRFKRNCTNFGSLVDKSDMKLMKWEDLEDKGIGHWRFSCVLSFPWKPILSATGYTEYYFDALTGKVCRHVEHWNVPKMALFKQILRPSRGLKKTGPTP